MPLVSRRQLFGKVSQGIATLVAGRGLSNGPLTRLADGIGLTQPLSGWSLYRDVRSYSQLGEHLTATNVDLATGDWLERHLVDAGFETERQTFTIRQSSVQRSTLLAGSSGRVPVEAIPLWPVTFTADPIECPLVELNPTDRVSLQGKIALASFPFSITGRVTTEIADLIRRAAQNGAVAIVGITEGPTELPVAMNPLEGQEPWPIPVLLVGPKDRSWLTAASQSGVNVTLVIEGATIEAAPATNVVGRLIRTANAPWIVISTPYSGWFRCGGERGPGIALWRGLSRWIASRWTTSPTAPCNYLFVATSGHELGGVGMSAYLASHAPKPEQVAVWLHLGAWMTSYAWPLDAGPDPQADDAENPRFLNSLNIRTEALAPLLKLPNMIPQEILIGEIAQVIQSGYTKALAITGRNVPHHTRWDLPFMTGPRLLERTARALTEFLAVAESSPHVDSQALRRRQ